MTAHRSLIVLTVVNLAVLVFTLAGLRPAGAQGAAPVLRGRGLEIVDDQGRVRASITVMPAGSAAAFTGTFESDEGRVTTFERDGGLRFRQKESDTTGVPLAYVGDATFRIGGGTEGRFLLKDGHARANAVYTNGLFMDAMMRVRD